MRNTYKISIGKAEGKRQFQKNRHYWMDSIEMDLREIGFEDLY
jgi:hypothetical protein